MLAGNDAYFPEFESDDFLEEVVLTTSASSVTFSGLASYATAGYKHLQIRAVVRESSAAVGYTNSELRFNGDTGSNYSWHYLAGKGSSVLSTDAPNQPNVRLQSFAPGDGSPSGVFGAGVIDILDFASTSKNKTVRALHGALTSTNTGIHLTSGAWYNTGAVTSINFAIGSNSFLAGTRFSLYGSKG
jgi:hypothetical protein